jgi:hypothetical protein
MTTDDLTALQALRAKMTPGEWQWRYDALGTDYPQWSIQPGILIADGTDGTPGGDMIDKANAAGIVALVNAAPALLASAARVAELEAEVSRLRHTATDMVQHVEWLTSGLPALLENDGLTDEEGLIGAATDAAKSARAALGDQP